MSNHSENEKKKEEQRKELKEREKTRREKMGGYFYDLSKLSFGGLVISIVLPLFVNIQDWKIWCTIALGITLTIISALFANKILK